MSLISISENRDCSERGYNSRSPCLPGDVLQRSTSPITTHILDRTMASEASTVFIAMQSHPSGQLK